MKTSQILIHLIQLSGLNQTQFANKHGTDKYHISKCVNNKENISLKTLTEMAKKEGYELKINYKLEKI